MTLVAANHVMSMHPLTSALQPLNINRYGTKACMHKLCNAVEGAGESMFGHRPIASAQGAARDTSLETKWKLVSGRYTASARRVAGFKSCHYEKERGKICDT